MEHMLNILCIPRSGFSFCWVNDIIYLPEWDGIRSAGLMQGKTGK